MDEKEYNDVEVLTVLRNIRNEIINICHYDEDMEKDLIEITRILSNTITKVRKNIIIDEEG